MKNRTFQIRVPGSTSNIGPGFDSIGIALNLYLTLICSPGMNWSFEQKNKENSHLPKGKDNMIYKVAEQVAKEYGIKELPPYKVEIFSEIPVARGLGSSGAVTAAGVELANQLLQLDLTLKEKILLASKIEGHPDNVAPIFMGGCVVSYLHKDELFLIDKKGMKDIVFVAIIPNFELKTKAAREVLPDLLPYDISIEGSAIANVCTAAIFQENYALLGEVMEKDVLHQPYRKKLIPHYHEFVDYMREEGAYGTFLSGAGPTMISLCQWNKAEKEINKWRKRFKDVTWKLLSAEDEGIKVTIKEPFSQRV
jgi:homoserine kinase